MEEDGAGKTTVRCGDGVLTVSATSTGTTGEADARSASVVAEEVGVSSGEEKALSVGEGGVAVGAVGPGVGEGAKERWRRVVRRAYWRSI